MSASMQVIDLEKFKILRIKNDQIYVARHKRDRGQREGGRTRRRKEKHPLTIQS